MDDSNLARRRRALERKARTIVRRTTLQAVDDDGAPICGAEALSLAATLSRAAWAMTGRPISSYRREDIPCVFIPNSPART